MVTCTLKLKLAFIDFPRNHRREPKTEKLWPKPRLTWINYSSSGQNTEVDYEIKFKDQIIN